MDFIQDATARFSIVEKRLKTRSWFIQDGWLVAIKRSSRFPDFVVFHVYKKHWLTTTGLGFTSNRISRTTARNCGRRTRRA
jgi:hypothetical protein